jgi:hypothetical protein
MEPIHRCHAKRCMTVVPPRLLMCTRHWRMVSYPLQRAVWQHYRKGQETDKRPTPEYLAAAKNACDYVEELERERRENVG